MPKLKKCYCSVLHCKKNSVTHPELSYFRLPKFPDRAAIWLKNIQRENSTAKKILVCELHFDSRYISINETRKRVMSAAIPTLNLPDTVRFQYAPDSEMLDYCTIGTQTDETNMDIKPNIDEDSTVAFTHIIKMEREDEPECKSEVDIEETQIISPPECSSDDDASINISKMMKMYHTIMKAPEGLEHADDFKFFALQLYFTSPLTYKVLQKTLKLPSISDLHRLCIPTSTEIDENIVKALKVRVNDMTDDQKQCAVCIGTMALKPNLFYDKQKDRVIGFHEVDGVQILEPAKFLFIVMVRGLFHDWKQVITYSLLASHQNYKDVKIQIDKAFLKLFDIGLNVRVFISDMESELMSASLERKITPELPYFFINGHRIYYMYDPPHIIRAVWNNLPNYDFQVGDALIKWKYISEFYEIDKSRSVKLAPKLTICHMKPKDFGNVEVRRAAEVFSNTTAAGISACIDMELFDDSAKHTVEWILKLNKLFDMLNFSSFADKTKIIFSGEQSQFDFMRETMFWLDQMRLVDGNGKEVNCTTKSKFIRGYKITINTILSLYEHFKIENRTFVQPRFSRDCIDKFIEKVLAKYRVHPTCKSMMRIIRTLPIFSVFQWIEKKKGSDDLERFLKLANDVSKIQVYTRKVASIPKTVGDLGTPVDFTTDIIPKDNRLQYIASYVLHEASQRHKNCHVFNDYVLGCTSKGNADDDAVFVSAPPHFVQFIQLLDSRIKSHFQLHTVNNPILAGLIKSVEDVEFATVTQCECFPIEFIKILYVSYRFDTLLNYNNKQLRNCKNCRKSFTVHDFC